MVPTLTFCSGFLFAAFVGVQTEKEPRAFAFIAAGASLIAAVILSVIQP